MALHCRRAADLRYRQYLRPASYQRWHFLVFGARARPGIDGCRVRERLAEDLSVACIVRRSPLTATIMTAERWYADSVNDDAALCRRSSSNAPFSLSSRSTYHSWFLVSAPLNLETLDHVVGITLQDAIFQTYEGQSLNWHRYTSELGGWKTELEQEPC